MLTYGFYNSVNKDRRYDAEQIGAMFNGLINDGIYANYKDAMKIVPGSGKRHIVIRPGRAWFNGTWTLIDDGGHSFYIAGSQVTTTYYIYLYVGKNDRMNSIAYYNEIRESEPDKGKFFYLMGQVTIPAGVNAITEDMIVDLRGSTQCPFVTGILETADFEQIVRETCSENWLVWLNSYEEGLDAKMAQIQELADKANASADLAMATVQNLRHLAYRWAKYRSILVQGGSLGWTLAIDVPDSYGEPPKRILYREFAFDGVNCTLSDPVSTTGITAADQYVNYRSAPYFNGDGHGGTVVGRIYRYERMTENVKMSGNSVTITYGYRISRAEIVEGVYKPGAYIETVEAQYPSEYPLDGYKDGYWYTRFASRASDVFFDNTGMSLSARTVQEAVEALYKNGGNSNGSGNAGGGVAASYVASDEPPEDTQALWVNTTEPEEAVALGVTAVETAEGVDLYCTDELGTTKVTVRHGKDGEGSGENGGGTTDYTALSNKPSINGVTLEGNKTSAELGIGQPSDEQVGAAVGDWLEAHPEATTVVADRSITPAKTTFIEPVSDNLIDMSKVVKGYQGDTGVPAGGSLPNTTTGCTTDYIEVEPGATYNSVGGHGTSGWMSSWYYDADKNPVSVVPSNPFTVPEGVTYVRLTFFNNAEISTLQLGLYRGSNPMVYTQGAQRYALDGMLTDAVKSVLDANSVFKVTAKNLYRFAALGSMDSATGIFTLSGGSLNISDYIEVTPGIYYISNCFAAANFSACYDKNREYISAFGDATEWGAFVTHDGGTYQVFKITNPDVRYIVNGSSKILSTPIKTPFIVRGNAMPDSLEGIDISTPDMVFVEAAKKLLGVGGGKLSGKVLAGLGNSITVAGAVEHGYLSRIADKMGVTAINYGVNGSWVSCNEAMAGQEMCTRYADMTDDADYITVKGGINDINNHAPLGALGDTEKTTFYGALDILCQGLLEKYPGKKIAYITPLYYDSGDAAGQYIRAIFEVCNQYGIPVIDMYYSGPFSAAVPAEIRALYFYDGLHPNAYGHEVMARYIGQQLEWL